MQHTLTEASVDWDGLGDAIAKETDELDLVRSGLDDTMRNAYQDLRKMMANNARITDLRTAGYAIAIDKISRHYLDIGVY